jgi:hypothetical protein
VPVHCEEVDVGFLVVLLSQQFVPTFRLCVLQ